nr:response regulator transcription factor [Candidatus Dojkabacteria bacterium]
MNILIIEDFKNTGQIIKGILDANKYITQVIDSTNYQLILKQSRYSLIILDLHTKTTSENSLEILRDIKSKYPNIFLIGISSKATWNEKVEFLNSGADDVIDYPFPIQELIARIDSLKRRPKNISSKHLKLNDLEIDTELKTVTIRNKDIPLRKKEYSLLEYLVRNKNRIVSRMELLDH